MNCQPRRASARVAVLLCALVTVSVLGPAAVADPGPTVGPAGTTTTTGAAAATTTGAAAAATASGAATTPTSSSTSTSSTTSTTAAPTIGTSTTSVAPSTTSTTLDPVQLAKLINGLDADMAQARAVSDYLAAQAAAAALGAGQPLPPTADPVLVDAAAAQLKASTDQAAAQQKYGLARHRIGQVAVALYVGEQNPPSGSAGTDVSADRSAFLSSILDGEQQQAKSAQDELARATAAATASRAQADRLVQSRTAQLQAQALQAGAAAQSAIVPGVAAGASGAPTSLLAQDSPTILGPSILSADELAGWFAGLHRHPSLTVPLAELAADFESVGATAGVRSDIAFAQSMVETGYLSFPTAGQVAIGDNNFAGIGACDSCATGFHFPDVVTGVQAQMQLLHAYATTAQPVAGPLPGPFSVAGCCPTWMALSGVWATGPNYGVKILRVYQSMVQWALARRSATARL